MLTITKIRVYWVLFDDRYDVTHENHIYKSLQYRDVAQMAFEKEPTLLPAGRES